MWYRRLGIVLWTVVASRAMKLNMTIDDTFGDEQSGEKPSYVTTGIWGAFSDVNHCVPCVHNPDYTQAHNRTLHTNTFNADDGRYSNMSFSFTGHAVWVYVVTANQHEPSPTRTQLAFSIDGVFDTMYVHQPTNGASGYNFNVLAYSSTSLAPSSHTLLMSNVGSSANPSITWFDYAIYETETNGDGGAGSSSTDPQSTAAPRPSGAADRHLSIGVIVGGVLGACAVILLLVVFIVWRAKRKHTTHQIDDEMTSPYHVRSDSVSHRGPATASLAQQEMDLCPWEEESHAPSAVSVPTYSQSGTITLYRSEKRRSDDTSTPTFPTRDAVNPPPYQDSNLQKNL